MRRLLLWLVAHVAAKTKYDVVDRDDATTFGILIDAGSTGSRVHIYQWEKRDFNTLPPPLSLPLTSERWTERIKPGLSDYNDDAERAAKTLVPVWKSNFHGAFDLHAIDVHPTHWLICTQVAAIICACVPRGRRGEHWRCYRCFVRRGL